MCFSVPMMFELIPFNCSRMALLAEVSAKWINFDYLSLTSFDFCKSLIAACSHTGKNNGNPDLVCKKTFLLDTNSFHFICCLHIFISSKAKVYCPQN